MHHRCRNRRVLMMPFSAASSKTGQSGKKGYGETKQYTEESVLLTWGTLSCIHRQMHYNIYTNVRFKILCAVANECTLYGLRTQKLCFGRAHVYIYIRVPECGVYGPIATETCFSDVVTHFCFRINCSSFFLLRKIVLCLMMVWFVVRIIKKMIIYCSLKFKWSRRIA